MKAEVRSGLEFFAESFVGEAIDHVDAVDKGFEIRFRGGIRAVVKGISRTEFSGEKIIGFHMCPDASHRVIVLSLDSGDEVTLCV
jgi:hypothetical protein